MRKKRCLTLLEILISMVLIGILLTGLFNTLRQGLKKSISVKELKQKVLQLELFQQRMKKLTANLADPLRIALRKHPDAEGFALITTYKNPIDSDFEMRGDLQAMVFLNHRNEVCLASWSENGKGRIEVLLDNVDAFYCQLFDIKKGIWQPPDKPLKKNWTPIMFSIDLLWNGKEVPFVFFTQNVKKPAFFTGSE